MFNLVLIYLFFMIDGPFIVLDIVSQSYQIIPPDKMLTNAFFADNSYVFAKLIRILGNVVILSTQLAAPALIMILMTDFFLGIANRLAPQVQITFLGMPLKSLLALTIVFFGWQLFNEEIINQGYKSLNAMFTLIKQFAPPDSG
jgi:type III secretion protein T